MLPINPLKAHSTCFEPTIKNVLGIKKIYQNLKMSAYIIHSMNDLQVLLAIIFFKILMYIPLYTILSNIYLHVWYYSVQEVYNIEAHLQNCS